MNNRFLLSKIKSFQFLNLDSNSITNKLTQSMDYNNLSLKNHDSKKEYVNGLKDNNQIDSYTQNNLIDNSFPLKHFEIENPIINNIERPLGNNHINYSLLSENRHGENFLHQKSENTHILVKDLINEKSTHSKIVTLLRS